MHDTLPAPQRRAFPSAHTAIGRWRREAIFLAAAIFGAYYLGACLGFALTFKPQPISVLWPPNAILFAALLLTPPRSWWIVVAAALPAHVASEMRAGVPATMVASWFVSNVSEALVGAVAFRALAGDRPHFERVRNVMLFLLAAAVSVIASSFLDSAFVRLNGWGSEGFWSLWVNRTVSNLAADVVLIPAIVALTPLRGGWPRMGARRAAEATALALGLACVTLIVFNADVVQGSYLPILFLVWAALRFGPGATHVGFALVALGAIWGAGHGVGVLGNRSPIENAHAVQLFVLTMGPMLLMLAAALAERRSGEESIRASDRRFRLVLEATTDTVYERSLESSELWWSRNGRSQLGYARMADLPNSDAQLVEAIHADDREHVVALQQSAMRDGSNTWEVEFRLRRADGSHVHVQEQAFIIRDSLGKPVYVVGMLTDLTEKRDIEELDHRLSQASRLTTMGELAASIAHEINQPITAILMNVEAARVLLESGNEWRDEFGLILEEIGADDLRASEIVKHFRNLATKHALDVESFDLNEVVRAVIRLATPTARRRGITLRAEHSDIPFARADRIHLQQVLLNLLFNGMDAMGDAAARDRVLTVKTTPAGDDMIRVSVRDTGHGIPDGTLPRIFDSFFTTKTNGLGLGLAIARSLVSGWGGRIWAENNDAGGATFSFIVPVDAALAPAAPHR